jgi:hypothetical protein
LCGMTGPSGSGALSRLGHRSRLVESRSSPPAQGWASPSESRIASTRRVSRSSASVRPA